MNFVHQFNLFWQKDLEYSFTPNEIAVYMRLLNLCNALGWKNPFNLGVDKLMVQLGLKTQKPLDTARLRLRAAGLLEFKNGNGRGKTTEYTIHPAPAERGKKNNPLSASQTSQQPEERGPEKGNKNTPLSGPLSSDSAERGPERGKKNNPLKGGTTINQTKQEKIGAASAASPAPKSGKGAVKKPAKPTGATAQDKAGLALPHLSQEFAELWLAFHTGSAKQHDKPLSAFELMLKKLSKYPEAFAVLMLEGAIQGNWSGVENDGTAKRYQDWLAQQASAPLPTAAGPDAFPTPELNHEFIAQQEAESAREIAERLNRFAQPELA